MTPDDSREKLSDPSGWVDLHGDHLYRYALLRLREPHLAEEAVQETFTAALEARESFKGLSSERTWLVGILKRKVVDHFRRKKRELPVEDVGGGEDPGAILFDRDGRWERGPSDWGEVPSRTLEKKEFWEVFLRCLRELPPKLADAFSLREMDGLDSKEVCKVLGISTSNLWVRLFRARALLRECLEANWFEAGEGEGS